MVIMKSPTSSFEFWRAETVVATCFSNTSSLESLVVDAFDAYVESWDAYAGTLEHDGTRKRRAHNLRLTRELVETAIFALLMFLAVRMVVQNFRVVPTRENMPRALYSSALRPDPGVMVRLEPL